MILMLAPGPNMAFGAMPSGASYVSDDHALIQITNNSAADQLALQEAGCFTLTPCGGWGTFSFNLLTDLYAADSTSGLVQPGQVGFPQYVTCQVMADPVLANNGTWYKSGTGNGSGNWTYIAVIASSGAVAAQAAAGVATDGANTAKSQAAIASAQAAIATAAAATTGGASVAAAIQNMLSTTPSALPYEVTNISGGVGSGSGGTPGEYALVITGGPAGHQAFGTIGADGKAAGYRNANPGISTSNSAPTYAWPSAAGITGATVPTATVDTIPAGRMFYAPTSDGLNLGAWGNNAGSLATAPFGGTQLTVPISSSTIIVESLDPAVLSVTDYIDPSGNLAGQVPDPRVPALKSAVYVDAIIETLDPDLLAQNLRLDGNGKLVSPNLKAWVQAISGPQPVIVESLDPAVITGTVTLDANGNFTAGGEAQAQASQGTAPNLATRLNRGLHAEGIPRKPVWGEWNLRETHMRLSRLERGDSAQLVIALLGDSYVAGDYWSAAFAKSIQTAYGLAGVGWVGFAWWGTSSGTWGATQPTGIDGNARPDLVPAPTITGTWTASYNNGGNATPSLGLVTSSTAGDRINFSFPSGHTAANLYYKGTSGGVVRYSWDGGATWAGSVTLSGTTAASAALASVPAGAAALTLEVVSGTVSLSGVDMQSSASGVRVHKLGASGSATNSWSSVSASVWNAQIAALAPNCVIAGWQTNDQGAAFVPEVQFKGQLLAILNNLITALPYADILLTSPAENNRTTNTYPMSRYTAATRQLVVDSGAYGLAHLDHQFAFGWPTSSYAYANGIRQWIGSDLVHPVQTTSGRLMADNVLGVVKPNF